jgi:hypothetical protein
VKFQLKSWDIVVDKSDTVKSFLAPNSDLVLFLACVSNQPQEATADSSSNMAQPENHADEANATSASFARRVKDEPRDDPDIPVVPEVPMNQDLPVDSTPTDATPNVGESNIAPTEERAAHAAQTALKNEIIPGPFSHHMDEESQQVPFDPEKFFERELSPEQANEEEIKPADRSIREIMSQQDPHVLEAAVAKSMNLLQSLKDTFSHHTSEDGVVWTEAIDKLIPQAERKRTIVGVVGNTGAGKSSVINAMLDEERLVPTNCMRACTAVVTEMSWNPSTNPAEKYRAEIEFVSRNEWEKELATLMKEFLTETGTVSREVGDETTDAGIAWAKFHSVYPKRTRDSLSNCTVESLMSEKSVLAVLGTTKRINTQYPNSFYRQLQRYVDSKEKVTKKGKDKDKDEPKKKFDMEYWPLIKVVKIYVKAPALSTGAVIVDLPGVHDSNAARAAVAQGYMKQCTGLWIVAPINRAVDDKAAKTLLGESFKRQLKYDGGFSSVTFICSKTDDISITEAVDTLELNDEVEDLFNRQQHLEQGIKTMRDKIKELKETQDVYRIAQKDAASEIDIWEKLQEDIDDGKTAYAPIIKTKRKRVQQKSARKRRQRDPDDSDDDFITSDEESMHSESDSDSDDEIQAPRNTLTEADIKSKLKELRDAKKGARREGSALTGQIKELQDLIKDSNQKIAVIKAQVSHICIAGRNDYSKRAIQQDFAAGIKELVGLDRGRRTQPRY